MRTTFLLIIALFALAGVRAQKAPDDCSWQSGSKSRKTVKSRSLSDGAKYTNFNRGRAISIDEWFKFTCGLDPTVPDRLPEDSPLVGSETTRVTLRGYLVAARFERDDDHDIHVELAATPDWNDDHVMLEMSAGPQYCRARRQLWNLLRRDRCKGDQCILRKPVEVLVTGYVLVGNPPQGSTAKDFCNFKLARGMKKTADDASHTRGLWRLQPVFSIIRVRAR
jgi:hypothetical protein